MTGAFLVKNAVIINEGLSFKGGIFVDEGIIADIYDYSHPDDVQRQDEVQKACGTVYDLKGKYLAPGVIDEHVHFREPGATRKGCIASESAAAVIGGVTSYLDMPNNNPPAVDAATLAAKYDIAARDSFANYAFYLGATDSNIDEIEKAADMGACAVKVFFGSSTGNLLVEKESSIRRIFERSPLMIAAHCEDNSIIAANLADYKNKYGDAIPFAAHPLIRSREACLASTSKAVALALETGARLHIMHVSTLEEVELLSKVTARSDRVTAETCVQYLWFCDSDYEQYGARIKCNPAIKSAADRSALQDAVRAGIISAVSTDHAPHLISDKQGAYMQAASGIPLLQYSLLMMLEKVKEGVFSLPTVVDRMCHAPARLFGVKRRGFIRKGYYADLVAFDMDSPSDVSPASRCAWTPLSKFSSTINYTFVGGRLAARDGSLVEDASRGSRLEFERH